jgi:hypothetical protein
MIIIIIQIINLLLLSTSIYKQFSSSLSFLLLVACESKLIAVS